MIMYHLFHSLVSDVSSSNTVFLFPDFFWRTFLHVLSGNRKMFDFFLNHQINEYSDEYIHLTFDDLFPVRNLLELMIVEYANLHENTQEVLKSLTRALLMLVERQYESSYTQKIQTFFLKRFCST